MDPKLAEVLAKFEPQLRAAVEAMLRKVQSSASLSTIEAFVVQGDIAGLVGYVQKLYAAAAPEMIAVLSAIVAAAGVSAEADIRAAAAKVQRENRRLAAQGLRLMPVPVGAPQMPQGPAGITFYGEGKTPDAPGYRFNPINPKTIAATRTWQGNLIQQMSLTAREGIMAQVREGLLAGENPRTTARKIRVGLPLTASQQGHVASFADDIDRIVADGMRSARSWGIYTAKDIADLKANDPKVFRQLNFTAKEQIEGRRWAKISRAAGTLAEGQKPIGFVADPRTQGGENAFRIDADGNPIDRMTRWRLRDKTMDPYIFDVVDAQQKGDKVALAKAKAALKAKAAEMKARYGERYIKHRSQVIARTEGLRAANLGSYESWRQAVEDTGVLDAGQVRRKWITAKDDRVRPDHRGAAGQERGFNEPFEIGPDRERVMFPPHQPNCRCTTAYRVVLTAT
jgi:hypothetical protein